MGVGPVLVCKTGPNEESQIHRPCPVCSGTHLEAVNSSILVYFELERIQKGKQ